MRLRNYTQIGKPPPRLWKGKRDFNLAIDLTLIPYHGQPYEDKKEIMRSHPKSGTTHFHGYATVSIVRDKRRYVLALRFIEYSDEMSDIVRRLIKRVKALKIRIRRVFVAKGFCSRPVFKVLARHKLSFVTPNFNPQPGHSLAVGRAGFCLVQSLCFFAPELIRGAQTTAKCT